MALRHISRCWRSLMGEVLGRLNFCSHEDDPCCRSFGQAVKPPESKKRGWIGLPVSTALIFQFNVMHPSEGNHLIDTRGLKAGFYLSSKPSTHHHTRPYSRKVIILISINSLGSIVPQITSIDPTRSVDQGLQRQASRKALHFHTPSKFSGFPYRGSGSGGICFARPVASLNI